MDWEALLSTPSLPPVEEAHLLDEGSLEEAPSCSSAAAAGERHAGAGAAVDRWSAADLSYDHFEAAYMHPGKPMVVSGAIAGWAACSDLVTAGGGIDLESLEQRFGAATVPVTDCSRHHRGSGLCTTMALSEYVAWWRSSKAQQQAQQAQAQQARRQHGSQLLYLKDWHCASEFPGYTAYTCPPWFQDDWLNAWYASRSASGSPPATTGRATEAAVPGAMPAPSGAPAPANGGALAEGGESPATACAADTVSVGSVATSDYRFVYLGPKGTCTPLHADVLRSYSWSANVAGRKRWRLLAPKHAHLLRSPSGREVAWGWDADDASYSAGAAGNEDSALPVGGPGRFPGLALALALSVEVVQEAGEAIFVPSGWYHTVENLEDTLSINHNWLNAHNVHWAWALARRECAEAAAGIKDCQPLCSPSEWEGLVQRNMAANCGLDLEALGSLLRCALLRALHALEEPSGGRPGVGPAAGGGPGALAARAAFAVQRVALVLQELLVLQRRRGWESLDGGAAFPREVRANEEGIRLARAELGRLGWHRALPGLGGG